jgi:hypothetical protein
LKYQSKIIKEYYEVKMSWGLRYLKMHDIRHNKNAKKDIYEIKTELEKKTQEI